jgi:hypothetical protein
VALPTTGESRALGAGVLGLLLLTPVCDNGDGPLESRRSKLTIAGSFLTGGEVTLTDEGTLHAGYAPGLDDVRIYGIAGGVVHNVDVLVDQATDEVRFVGHVCGPPLAPAAFQTSCMGAGCGGTLTLDRAHRQMTIEGLRLYGETSASTPTSLLSGVIAWSDAD